MLRGVLLWKILSVFMLVFFFLVCVSRAFVPAVLLGEADSKTSEQHAKMQDQSPVRESLFFFFKV